MPESSSTSTNLWIVFAMMAFSCWGLYGVFLHLGQAGMADPVNGRYKAYFMVGIAYVLIAVISPGLMLLKSGAAWDFPTAGWTRSLIAGCVGAFGAFFVLLSFGAKGHPAAVMSIVFAGAPIVNAVVALSLHPPQGGVGAIRWQFFAGILLAACGATLVTFYKPGPGAPVQEPPPTEPAADGGAAAQEGGAGTR